MGVMVGSGRSAELESAELGSDWQDTNTKKIADM